MKHTALVFCDTITIRSDDILQCIVEVLGETNTLRYAATKPCEDFADVLDFGHSEAHNSQLTQS